jgi:squalene-hopene/tetraprenyl-beta-curcumene cyclase
MDSARLRAAYEQVKRELLAERTPDGHWVGELSSSALATATAVSALAMVKASGRREPPDSEVSPIAGEVLDDLIARGIRYLTSQQNSDGGFGDTDLSHSNIATTYLVFAALHLAGVADEHSDLIARANAYIETKGGLEGLRERYGIDKTFVVPIMTNLALAGLLDWREIEPLPFELACVPQSLYRFVGMPVVSYAIPALVAIGQARYFHVPPRNPVTRLVRWLSITRSLQVLRRMQPDSGGYLEATPLTAFVVMSLASSRHAPRDEPNVQRSSGSSGHFTRSVMATVADEVIHHGVKFLANSIRPDGSWPIDTNLATWNTTLAINALAGAGEDVAELLGPKCLDWLLSCQHTERHPFTGADPGGFGWSDLSGAVADADDTPGALIAMCHLNERHAWGFARNWLRGIQNADGGWPTFCKGWGRLPFDRSGTDLTAHAIRAFRALGDPKENEWRGTPDGYFQQLYGQAVDRGLAYLARMQNSDGSWSPLWFGNQDHPHEDNPVYGTAKVLFAYRDLELMNSAEARRGVAWLVANQNEDGGWGSGVWGRARSAELGARSGVETGRAVTGAASDDHSVLSTEYSVPSTSGMLNPKSQVPNLTSSVEETALAVEALLAAPSPEPRTPSPSLSPSLAWLIERVERGEHRQPAPIGFYFAKLWYYERLYPLTFTVAALGRACRQFACPAPLDSNAQPAPARVP